MNYANQRNLLLAVISLDQASAYDCVEHPLFHALKKLCFGKNFIKNVCTLYRNAQELVEINGMLGECDKETPSPENFSP
jgi:hypothetical protein